MIWYTLRNSYTTHAYLVLFVRNERESSTVAVSLATFVSFTIMGIPNGNVSLPIRYLAGYYISLFGLLYRELTILQESAEGKMCRDPTSTSTIRCTRFSRSLIFRLFQVSPMIVWIWIISANQMFVYVLLWSALVFALIEHYCLWV